MNTLKLVKFRDSYVLSLQYVLIVIVVILPVLNNNFAIWDGVILVNAIDSQTPQVLFNIFYEAGSIRSASFHVFVFNLSELLGLSGKNIYKLIISALIFLVYYESRLIINYVKKTSPKDNLVMAFLYSILPFNILFLSDIFVNQLLSFYFCLLSVRTLLRKEYTLSLVFSTVSAGVQVHLLFHPLLFFLIYCRSEINHRSNHDILDLIKYYLVYVFFVLGFSFINSPTGQYIGYNNISFSRFFSFFTDFNILLKILFLVPGCIALIKMKNRTEYFILLIGSLSLLGVYYLAGKVNIISLYQSPFSFRFDMSYVYYCYFLICVAFVFTKTNTLIRWLILLSASIVFMSSGYYALNAMRNHLSYIHGVYQTEFSDYSFISSKRLRFYELNFHLKRKTANDLYSIASRKNLEKKCGYDIDEIYRQTYICGSGDYSYDRVSNKQIEPKRMDIYSFWNFN